FDTNRAACDALSAAVPMLDARTRADMFARTDALASARKGQRTALVAAAKLFAALSDAKARKRLFTMLDRAQPQAVRTHALAALVQCLRNQTLSASEIEAVLSLLD